MKTSIIKLSSLLLMLLSGISATAYDFMVDSIAYNVNSDGTSVTVTFTQPYSPKNYSGLTTLNIPQVVTYNGTTYSVTAIGDDAFYYCYDLTNIILPNTISSIGYNAFYFCYNLKEIVIPNSVISIGGESFMNCKGLTSVTIGESVKSIGVAAFRNCTSLTQVIVPNSVTYLGDGAFQNCI